ncbi:PREDICTED: CMP-sialic acid transporter 1-like [Branchiostoma belcheri]|uniref:CMP-sialic acid transporter 1-like n=1 Tax=Branchiostoma belcheri TaxID=7741 RepID=A0A6P4YGG1_BRABE|nr:PREDICTED: CMP-sialic acid transporter 1-like [Branchiostoma belcheri]
MSSSVETNTTIDMERKKGKPSETRGLRANNSPLMTARAQPSNMTSLSYCAIFITLEVAKQVVTYATRHYNNGVYPISSSAIVCCIELVKLLMVLIPVMFTTGLSSFRPSIVFAVPSIIYCANNNLYLVALNYTTPPTWNVLIQSRVIMTALTYRIIFGRQISVVRWVALLLLMLGIALAQLAGSSSSPASQDIYVLPQALGLSLVSAAISTAASIITEYLFKNDKRPFMEQQVQMYAFGFLIASIWSAVATKGDVFKISGTESLRSDIVFLLVAAILLGGAGGLAVAAIIRSLDNIVKIYSASISILMTAAVCSFLFPEKFILNTAFVIAVLLILVSSILYDRQDLSNILPANMRVPSRQKFHSL